MSTQQPSISPEEKSNADYRNGGWWRNLPWWSKYLALPLVCGFGGMTALLVCLRMTPLPDGIMVNPTHIDSADGQRLAEWTLKGDRSMHVPLSQIPQALRNATIAVEDANFYHHLAFNPLSIGRALVVDMRRGKVVEGGSTITQQLAKNLFLSQDRTITRKLREALYAIQLELHESKDSILEEYLNAVYYGHGAYGVDAAAHLYFNKSVQNLDLAECAMLAGLPKGPSLYSPLVNMTLAKQRQHTVLTRMVQTGHISQAEADKAFQEPLQLSTFHTPVQRAPYFTSTAVAEAEQNFHLSPDDLYRGDLRIKTTLDPLLQQAAERAISTTLTGTKGLQAALVALDPQTGAIKAMVGGRDYGSSPYNRVFAERQPGSTFKAMLYAAALEHGWTPARQVNSEVTTFMYDQDKLYTVHDYGEFYAHRPLTMREAIARSDNVYAVTTNLDVGPDTVLNTAHRMGIDSQMKPYPSLALGVFPTSPLQVATAYATLANGGYRVTPFTVSEVRDDKTGDVWVSHPKADKALSRQVAFQMTDLLTSVFEPHGTGYSARQYLHGVAAAKTGTTKSDVWMVGYTPKLVCAVWVGYDDNRPLTLTESHLAAPIWAKFMGTAQQRLPSDWFKPPGGLVRKVIDPVTAGLATDKCSVTEADYFARGTEPEQPCPLHATPEDSAHKRPWYKSWLPHWF
ncbi:transglycosylase domain-containing protein [Alicyclobacillus pomorum]|uniref:transglycosylase domain-containing protein n=1 Tax=Alicyclobacillus pomorum TaxID=204470 RepID=UPI00041E03AB|nr:PBP1A family penicillin-binding protein [Alicyclobacillus pomorum]